MLGKLSYVSLVLAWFDKVKLGKFMGQIMKIHNLLHNLLL
jgi:hypothetical protein